MKKFLCLIAVICCSALWGFGQNVLSLSGTVYHDATGLPLAGRLVEVYVWDSTNALILLMANTLTDTSGNYSFVFSLANFPNGTYSGGIEVHECNGGLQTYHFLVPPGVSTYSGWDFYICQPIGMCQAGYIGANTNGGLTTHFTDFSTVSGASITSWSWQFGDGDTSHLTNPSHTYASTGTYYVCLSIATNGGCNSTFCDSVVVGAGPGICNTTLGYGSLGNGAFGFTANATGSGTVVGFNYDFGDGNSLPTLDSHVTYTYPNGGIYNACVTAFFSDSCAATSCITVNGNFSFCQADFYAVPDTSGQFSLLLINNSQGNGLSYFWDFGDGDSSTSAYPQHTYAGGGTYFICLDVVDSAQTCGDIFCDSIVVVNKLNTPFTINVVSLTGATAVAPITTPLNTWSLSPNPASNLMTLDLQLSTSAAVRWDVIDVNGRVLMAEDLSKLSPGKYAHTFDIGGLPDAIYLVRLGMGNHAEVKRLVVRH